MKNKSIKTTIFLGAAFILLLVLAAGCGEDTVTNTANNSSDNVSLSVKSDENALDNPADLVITEAKALITEVELETEPSGQSHYVRIDPFVIYFNMSGQLISAIGGNIPQVNYNKIKFKVHKPEDNETPPDPEFKEGTSGNLRYSFIVKGTYNGNSFVYKSRRSANLVINLNSVISFQGSSKNITMIFNPSLWFKSGGNFIDPRDPQFEDLIDDNLKNSFRKAFRDDNKDGLPDDN